MRSFVSPAAGLLSVTATFLLPLALHAQIVNRLGSPIASAPSRQAVPIHGSPVYAQPSQPVSSYFGTSQPYRGPVYTVPAYPVQDNQPHIPAGQTFPIRTYRNYGTSANNNRQEYVGRSNGDGSGNHRGPVFNIQGGFLPSRPVQVNTPGGQGTLPSNGYYPIYGSAPVYGGGYSSGVTVVTNGPTLLGGYYYDGYCDSYGANTYPSVYSTYSGFPNYIYSPASVIVLAQPYLPVYTTGYQSFDSPAYPVIYNENIYYVDNREQAKAVTGDDSTARKAVLSKAFPDGSYQAAFGDIERAWLDGNIAGLQKHLRNSDVKLSVLFKGKYSYSIATSDYVQITHDAFDKIHTISFKFDHLRKAKNGDVTAFGTHVYRTAGTGTDDAVPFNTDNSDTDRSDVVFDNTSGTAPGQEKTVNVAYTLRHQDGQWDIVTVDSTPVNRAP